MLDGMAGLWCVNLGYGRKELAEAAYRQMLELPYYNSFFQTAHPPAIELAKQLVDLTPPQFNHVFFTGLGFGRQRHGRAARAPLLGPARPAGAQGHHQPAERLPRQHHGRGEPRRHGVHARAGRPADPGHRPHPAAVLVRRGRRPAQPGRVRPEGRAHARAEDPRTGPAPGRGLHRRADPGRRRRDHPAGHLLARNPEDLRPLRHPAGRGRGHLRLRPHRALVRLEPLRHQARPHDDRQGPVVGLPADRRRHGRGPGGRRAHRQGRRVRPRLHLLGPSGGLRRRQRQPDADPAGKPRAAHARRNRPLPGQEVARHFGASAGGRGTVGRPDRRAGTGQGQGHADVLRQPRRGRHDLPRLLLRERPDHARGPRHDDHFAAAGDQPRADRRARREGVALPRPDATPAAARKVACRRSVGRSRARDCVCTEVRRSAAPSHGKKSSLYSNTRAVRCASKQAQGYVQDEHQHPCRVIEPGRRHRPRGLRQEGGSSSGRRDRRYPAAAAPASTEEKVVNVYNWSDYIDPAMLEEFTAETGIKVNYDVFDTNEVLRDQAAGRQHRLRRRRAVGVVHGAPDQGGRVPEARPQQARRTGATSTRRSCSASPCTTRATSMP